MQLQSVETEEIASVVTPEEQSPPALQHGASLSEAETGGLLARLEQQGVRRRRLSKVGGWLGTIIGGNTAIALAFYGYYTLRSLIGGKWNGLPELRFDVTDWTGIISHHSTPTGGSVVFCGAWIVLTAVMLACIAGFLIARRRQIRLSKALPRGMDKRAIAPMLEALTLGRNDLRAEALEALGPLLRQVDASDMDRFGPDHRAIMAAELEQQNETLREAMLHAMAIVGDADDAQRLDELCKSESDPERRAGLIACAEAISRRVASGRAANTYLRPAESQPNEDRLLRPSAPAGDSDPAALLRASAEF